MSLRISMGSFLNANDPRETKYWHFNVGMEHTVNRQLYHERRISEKIKRKIGSLSFSRDIDSIPGYYRPRMWAQYAENNQGVCIVFNKDLLIESINKVLNPLGTVYESDIQYTPPRKEFLSDELTDINRSDIVNENVNKIEREIFDGPHRVAYLFRKHEDWNSEAEYRILFKAESEKQKPYIYISCSEAIEKIVFGVDCPAPHNQINKVGEDTKERINLYNQIIDICKDNNVPFEKVLWTNGVPGQDPIHVDKINLNEINESKNPCIAKFSLDGYCNYGNILQSYALQEILLRYAKKVDTIWTQPDVFLPKTFWEFGFNWRKILYFILNRYNFRTDTINNIKSGKNGLEMARQARMRDFVDRYISYKKHGNICELQDLMLQYDFCIVGSDQVWNPHFGNYHQFFLGFVPEEKRLSYAASISTMEIPAKEYDFFVQGLKGMKTLSVREQAGADLIEQLTGRKAEVHVDPTLLLTADEWRSVSRRPTWYHGGEYLLTYFLGRRPAQIDAIAKELGLKVVNLLDEDVYEHYVTGVDEFLWAIDHASLVYTDSFHGSVFSILFQTPFVVCDRYGTGKGDVSEKMGSRLDTLLGYFGFQQRRTNELKGYRIENPLQPPAWERCEPVLARERARSDEYLRRVLGLQE